MDKKAVLYSDFNADARDEVMGFLEEEFGKGKPERLVMEDGKQEYIDACAMLLESSDEPCAIVTLGMGAREMEAPEGCFKRVELVMSAAPMGKGGTAIDRMIFSWELQELCKVPFAEDTWFGPFRTAKVSLSFRKSFGYAGFLFLPYHRAVTVKGVGDVGILFMLPLYGDEMAWIRSRKDGGKRFAEAYLDTVSEDEPIGWVDVRRKHFLPEE